MKPSLEDRIRNWKGDCNKDHSGAMKVFADEVAELFDSKRRKIAKDIVQRTGASFEEVSAVFKTSDLCWQEIKRRRQ
jgi:hypothetical protein